MQHVVQIAFDFDDDKVVKIAEKAIENDIDKIIRDLILDKFAPTKVSYMSISKAERDWSRVNEMMSEQLYKIIDEHREEIIEAAVSRLVKSVRTSKAFKDKLQDYVLAPAT